MLDLRFHINKMNRIILSMFFLIGFACEYKPQEIYEVEIQPITTAPEITVNLNFDTDTIYIPVNRAINLNYSVNDDLVRFAKFTLNNNHLVTIESKSGTFSINFNAAAYSTNHAYELKVEVFRGSGSGSLADEMLMEGFLYSKSFVLYFLDMLQMSPQITKVIPENGSLKIQWEKFKGLGFRNYHVFNTVFRKIAIIPEQNQTWLYDDSYVGINGEYYIVTETEAESYQSTSISYNYGLPEATVTHAGDMNLQINWGKSTFWNNISGYKIYEWYRDFNVVHEVGYAENEADTSFLYPEGRFAVKTKYFIQPIPKEVETTEPDLWGLWNSTSPTNDIIIGDEMPVIPFTFFNNPSGNFCYYSNAYYILKFDCLTETFTDSIATIGLCSSCSQDGTLLLSKNGQQMEIVNTDNMEVTRIVSVAELPDENEPFQWLIGNNKTGVFVNHLADFYFYDFENKINLAQFRIDGEINFGDVMKVSPDATYFCIRHIKGIYPNYVTELFKLENGNITTLLKDADITFFDFDPDSKQFIYYKNEKLVTVSLQNMSTIKESTLGNELFCDIDWNNNEYLVLNAERDMFSICDLESGSTKKQIKTYDFGTNQSDYSSIYLSNKTLFTQSLRLKLNY